MNKITIYPQYLSEEQVKRLLQEIRFGMLLDVLPEEFDPDVKLSVFEKIDVMYAQLHASVSNGCYFCDHAIDGNASEFNQATYLCIECQIKLANVITALGQDPSRLLKSIPGPRKVQKTRFHIG